ncbi:MAG: hypothetical protein IJB24_06190 [Clostridia bacterium]|nr:hypothetical protein [Clostridia bacterium]
MNKRLAFFTGAVFFPLLLSGCSSIGYKSTSMSVIYAATVFLSLILLVGYCVLVKQKDKWFYLLFSSVLVVNMGYFALSAAKTLEWALHANRLAYLGSVFLPLAMLMIIIHVCGVKCCRLAGWAFFGISIVVFLIAASPGYLDIYYKSVTLETVNGITVLNKEYGSFHVVYLVYLMAHFTAMIAIIVYSAVTKKLKSPSHAAVLLVAVGCNIGIWLLEQLVKIDFEFLSVSYIVTELFLIALYLMIQELKKQEFVDPAIVTAPAVNEITESEEDYSYFESQLCKLTPTERNVYELYVEGKGTKDVLEILNIKENTLKYHNKNIYSKLGVSSRKQLIEIARILNNKKSD